MLLPDAIEQHRTEIVERWLERAYRDIAPRAVPRADVLDELSDVIGALIRSLRRDIVEDRSIQPPPLGLAKSHGRQRFHAGYDISALVREHLVLRDVVFDVVAENGYRPDLAEVGSVDRFLFSALAESASTYALARDREVSEQAERYIGFLAHELRNPLGTARLALSVLRDRAELGDSPAAGSLERSLTRMNDLLDSALTDFVTRRAPLPECTRFDLGDFLRDVVAESAAEAASKGIATTVEVPEPVAVVADARLLRSAISNLVRNAIKFSHAETAVKVEGKHGEAHTQIAVTDGCGGLPPGSVERLFSPFVQAGADRSGFGLGLAIVRQVAEAHGGAVRVHDIPGQGCVFVLDIPDEAV